MSANFLSESLKNIFTCKCEMTAEELIKIGKHDAINYLKFESIAKIVERSFLENKELTVGDYLELSAQFKKSAKKIAA